MRNFLAVFLLLVFIVGSFWINVSEVLAQRSQYAYMQRKMMQTQNNQTESNKDLNKSSCGLKSK